MKKKYTTKKGYIYILRCPIRYRIIYVGATKNPEARKRNHQLASANKNNNTPITMYERELKKKGMEIIFEIVKECPIKEMKKWELYYLHGYEDTQILLNQNSF